MNEYIGFLNKLINASKQYLQHYIYEIYQNNFIYLVNIEIGYLYCVKELMEMLNVVLRETKQVPFLISQIDAKRTKNNSVNAFVMQRIAELGFVESLTAFVTTKYRYRKRDDKRNQDKLPFLHAPADLCYSIFKVMLSYTARLKKQNKADESVRSLSGMIYKYLLETSQVDTLFNSLDSYIDILELFGFINPLIDTEEHRISFKEVEQLRLKLINLYLKSGKEDNAHSVTSELNNYHFKSLNKVEEFELGELIKNMEVLDIIFKRNFNKRVVFNLNNFFKFMSSMVDIKTLDLVLSAQETLSKEENEVYQRVVLPLITDIKNEVN